MGTDSVPLVEVLFMFCHANYQTDIIDAFNSNSRHIIVYVDNLFYIDNHFWTHFIIWRRVWEWNNAMQ